LPVPVNPWWRGVGHGVSQVQVIDFSTLYVYIIAYLHTFVNTKKHTIYI
jgi:hypothetical protein